METMFGSPSAVVVPEYGSLLLPFDPLDLEAWLRWTCSEGRPLKVRKNRACDIHGVFLRCAYFWPFLSAVYSERCRSYSIRAYPAIAMSCITT